MDGLRGELIIPWHMSPLQLVLLALAGLALLAVAVQGLLLWLSTRLVAERAPDEIVRVPCEDGWVVELARYRGTNPSLPPVVCCHGIGANSISLDLAEEISLPRFLRARGFDVWLLDLRGRGGSAQPPPGRGPYDYDFADHARHDAKAAIDHVRRATGAPRVFWVGHSMGGMTAYGYAELHGDDALQAAVVCGSPASWTKRPVLAPLAHIAWLQPLPAIYHVLGSRIAAPLVGYWHPPVARLIVNPDNMAPRLMRIGLARAMANMSRRAIMDFAGWIKTNELRSGGRVFFADLSRITVPWLAIGGDRDHLVPAENVKAGIDKIGSADKRFFLAGKASGHVEHYGHIDLLLGRHCQEEIYRPIAEFLESHVAAREASTAVPASPAAVPAA
jgi:pimeloyl-ACP methyl ester carboxylesterase